MGEPSKVDGWSDGAGPEAALQALRTFYERGTRVFGQLLAQHGGSLARAKLLRYVALNQPVRSADIAATFGYAPRTVTEAIDGLERSGLISREPDPDDRRAKHIFVTPSGEDLLQSLVPIQEAYGARLFAALSPAEMDSLLAIIGKLNAALGDSDPASRTDDRPGR